MRFLSELDGMERKRHEENERETLLRVAKVMNFGLNQFLAKCCNYIAELHIICLLSSSVKRI